MIPKNFNLNDSASEKKLNFFVESLLGVERFSPDPNRLIKYFSGYKSKFRELKIPIIIVAGTNGKGEVSLLLEQYALDNNLVPHVWNSPHILSVRERISHNGHPIDASEMLSLFEENKELTKSLSYYEFLFKIFCESSLNQIKKSSQEQHLLILEVGLGGRLDATNFFDADLAILTSISRDHIEFLGSKLSGILKEKIAVARKDNILVSSVEQSFLRPLVSEYCQQEKINLFDLWSDEISEEMDFHQRNTVTAQFAFKKFYFDLLKRNDAVRINEVDHVWGRPIKMTYNGCQFILLGSHNLDGLRHLAKWTSKMNKGQNDQCSNHYFDQAWFSFSRSDKDDLCQCLSLIDESPCVAARIVLTSFNHPRATNWNTITESAEKVMSKIGTKVYFEQHFTTLLEELSKYKSDHESTPRVLLAGSYYFIGRFLDSLPSGSFLFE